MFVGTLLFELDIPSSYSLKDKRRVLNSLKGKLKNKFNISVSEVGEKNLWNRGYIAIAIVGDDNKFVDSQLQEVVKFAEFFKDVVVLDVKMEII
ncbi:MAG: DUF503 domain-containing protein [Calditerrivibrio sp.]|nr:DUF503 domain-containing protein [Calditerrivibrio sp.]MCA1932645.1 DUF503 domain-containing protein [Calditerrivibrio sp.]MCA1980419.1 DUF503 domain-containing protein [Calditerrivibrio sp.]